MDRMLDGIRVVEIRCRQCLQGIQSRLDGLVGLGEWMYTRGVWEGE
jgi:hypothetical protein